jgi:hypothetical protein
MAVTFCYLSNCVHFAPGPVPKLAGRDFQVLTTVFNGQRFERWIFPSYLGRLIAQAGDRTALYLGLVQRSYLTEASSRAFVCNRDPMKAPMDCDILYRMTRIWEEKAFFEGVASEDARSTLFQGDEIIFQAGSGTMKYRIDREDFSFSPLNSLLDGLLPPSPQ